MRSFVLLTEVNIPSSFENVMKAATNAFRPLRNTMEGDIP